jgi:hypothetical protein
VTDDSHAAIADRALELADENLDPTTAAGDLLERAKGDAGVLDEALRSMQGRLGAEGSHPSLQRALDYLTTATAMATPGES